MEIRTEASRFALALNGAPERDVLHQEFPHLPNVVATAQTTKHPERRQVPGTQNLGYLLITGTGTVDDGLRVR